MEKIKKMFARFFIWYGNKGAHRPSYHGFYEMTVPECLKRK